MADEHPTVHQAMAAVMRSIGGVGTCSLDYCDRPVNARGWCKKHYECWRRHGDPEGGSRVVADPEGNFWRKVDGTGPDECWLWTGAVQSNGYGLFFPPGTRGVLAHRYSYELSCEPIPPELVIDHLCRNRLCVNPQHLEVVTQQENVRRGLVPGRMAQLNREGWTT